MMVYSPLHRCLGLSLFCLWAASPAADGPLPDLAPAVRSVFPLGARAGETIEVTFFGRRLNDLADITFARKDIHCDVISSGDFIVKAKVSVGPDVPTGLHDYRVRTRRGTYVGVFHVSSYAALREVEPNNDLAHAQPVELPAMVDGVVESADYDVFRFHAEGGQDLVFDLFARRAGSRLDGTLARPSHFEGFTGAKPLRMSEGYPRVFTTEKGVGRPISG